MYLSKYRLSSVDLLKLLQSDNVLLKAECVRLDVVFGGLLYIEPWDRLNRHNSSHRSRIQHVDDCIIVHRHDRHVALTSYQLVGHNISQRESSGTQQLSNHFDRFDLEQIATICGAPCTDNEVRSFLKCKNREQCCCWFELNENLLLTIIGLILCWYDENEIEIIVKILFCSFIVTTLVLLCALPVITMTAVIDMHKLTTDRQICELLRSYWYFSICELILSVECWVVSSLQNVPERSYSSTNEPVTRPDNRAL